MFALTFLVMKENGLIRRLGSIKKFAEDEAARLVPDFFCLLKKLYMR